MNIVLTTFPEHRSGNVGDALITESLIKLVKRRFVNFNPSVYFREVSLDDFLDRKISSIIAPGFSLSNGVYPDIYRLCDDIGRLRAFYPIGCSFHSSSVIQRDIEDQYLLEEKNRDFLKELAFRFGAFPCRDALIVQLMRRSGVPAVLSGDVALFDDDRFGVCPSRVRGVESLVFTVGHHRKYGLQTKLLLQNLRIKFPWLRCFFAFHSKPNVYSRELAAYAKGLGYEILHVYGSVDNLRVYHNVDMHVGYRLHGHVAFQRERKPSFLMIEDIRGYGYSRTEGIGYGCIEAFNPNTLEPELESVERLIGILDSEFKSDFSGACKNFPGIDNIYLTFIDGYFNQLARNLQLTE